MAFLGYLLKINGVIFPNKFIAVETYQITPNQKTDEDSYVDGNGKLHRTVLAHERSKMEFSTPQIRESENVSLQSYFPNTVSMSAEYWNPRKHAYESGTFYTPDIVFDIFTITTTDVRYKPIRLALIEY